MHIGPHETTVRGVPESDPLHGYRGWKVLADGQATLASLYARRHGFDAWPKDKPLVAECVCPLYSYSPDHVTHTCGIYAYMNPAMLGYEVERQVSGQVALWGDIDIHAYGMRAQFARPTAIFPDGARLHVEMVAEQYSIPITFQPSDLRSDWARVVRVSSSSQTVQSATL